MRFHIAFLIPVMVLSLMCTAALKQKKTPPKNPDDLKGGIEGKITEIKENGVLVVKETKKEGAHDFAATTEPSTAIEIDGVKGKKVEDLKKGYHVSIKVSGGVAREIKATSPNGSGGAKEK